MRYVRTMQEFGALSSDAALCVCVKGGYSAIAHSASYLEPCLEPCCDLCVWVCMCVCVCVERFGRTIYVELHVEILPGSGTSRTFLLPYCLERRPVQSAVALTMLTGQRFYICPMPESTMRPAHGFQVCTTFMLHICIIMGVALVAATLMKNSVPALAMCQLLRRFRMCFA